MNGMPAVAWGSKGITGLFKAHLPPAWVSWQARMELRKTQSRHRICTGTPVLPVWATKFQIQMCNATKDALERQNSDPVGLSDPNSWTNIDKTDWTLWKWKRDKKASGDRCRGLMWKQHQGKGIWEDMEILWAERGTRENAEMPEVVHVAARVHAALKQASRWMSECQILKVKPEIPQAFVSNVQIEKSACEYSSIVFTLIFWHPAVIPLQFCECAHITTQALSTEPELVSLSRADVKACTQA